ncbi:related to STU1 - mitotic spindle protein [Cephalotrichum gorgonifer]|uniref:Related to STU1 - mitotic spindle protein n=1 Tax=Cephalotrichum gorgonifer TaxID=2041049 RepID=A0AAE8SYI1_9PEZI|nr:related to STU1 - mitotic spindle protein [Cephalotrichum gorgonifer]
MADKITDQQIEDLLALLAKTDASTDAKVQAVNAVKSGIKQHNVPETGVPLLFDALRTASASQHAVLSHAGFGSLNHLLTRMSRQEPKFIVKEAMRTMPLVVEKLGDQKEKLRAIAAQSLTTMYAVAPTEVERGVRNTAMSGKNPRAKEAAMHWVVAMHRDHGLPFRGYVPLLMDLLEDADGMVRDVAKTTVIELFKGAPNAAKSDLKRQLKNFKVRPAIEQAIVKELAPTAGDRSETPSEPMRPTLTASVSAPIPERPNTPMLDRKNDPAEPMYVNTKGELDELIRDMHYHFEGKETEQNWLKREESLGVLRRLIAGNAVSDFSEAFLNGVRSLLDGIIKAMVSLRTSLSKEACALVQDVANGLGAGIDPMVELLMQTLVKLCAATKKIASQQANATVEVILSKATYNNRLLQHVCGASSDKNVQPRQYATKWLRIILAKEEQHKAHLESGGGVEMIEKAIKKGLADANPGVREQMRATYWFFAKMWPARAEVLMDTLDATAQKLLQKDPNNPNSPKKAAPAVRPGLGLSRSTVGSGKPSLRDTVMAQKKASLATKNLPVRPGSAMSAFSPVKNGPNASSAAAEPSRPLKTRPRPESTLSVHPTGSSSGGMSGAPMRPTKRRPELAARPATAGPYSVRTHGGPSVEATSSADNVKPKTSAPKPAAGSPKPTTTSPRRVAQRPRPAGHVSHASESSLPSPTRMAASSKGPTPQTTPVKLKKSQSSPPSAGSVAGAEELTLVVPNLANLRAIPPRSSTPELLPPSVPSPILEAPTPAVSDTFPAEVSGDNAEQPLQVYEDPFVEDDNATPKPAEAFTGPVLEDKPINENAAPARSTTPENREPDAALSDIAASPEKTRQNSRLLESGITRVRARTLDVHGFRKLQSLIRDNKAVFAGGKFEALLLGLFDFLQDPLDGEGAPERAQDVKAQVLATIRLLLKKERFDFQPYVSAGLEALLRARSAYDARTYIVSGLELLADELVMLGDASELVMTLTALLAGADDGAPEGCRVLSMGTHALRRLLDGRGSGYVPSDTELGNLARLGGRCLESADSGVRRDAVQLCVAMHERVGEATFWRVMGGLGDDPKNVITYYIVKKQREQQQAA